MQTMVLVMLSSALLDGFPVVFSRDHLADGLQHCLLFSMVGVACATSVAEKHKCIFKGSANIMLSAALVSHGFVLFFHVGHTVTETLGHEIVGATVGLGGLALFFATLMQTKQQIYKAAAFFVCVSGWSFTSLGFYWSHLVASGASRHLGTQPTRNCFKILRNN